MAGGGSDWHCVFDSILYKNNNSGTQIRATMNLFFLIQKIITKITFLN